MVPCHINPNLCTIHICLLQTDVPQSPFLTPDRPANPFSGVTISKATLSQNLPDFDARSTVTSKSFKGLGLKKKDKIKMRHQLWMESML